jgi:hypothetical protein
MDVALLAVAVFALLPLILIGGVLLPGIRAGTASLADHLSGIRALRCPD